MPWSWSCLLPPEVDFENLSKLCHWANRQCGKASLYWRQACARWKGNIKDWNSDWSCGFVIPRKCCLFIFLSCSFLLHVSRQFPYVTSMHTTRMFLQGPLLWRKQYVQRTWFYLHQHFSSTLHASQPVSYVLIDILLAQQGSTTCHCSGKHHITLVAS